MKKHSIIKNTLCFFFLICSVLLLSVSVSAAQKNTWYTQNGRYYYYNDKGNLSKGTKKINGKYYYFNSKGRQRNGWIVSKGRYYYFRNKPGKGGYRLANTTVNGIKLQKNGIAIITNENRARLQLLTRANYIAFLYSNLTMTKEQRLSACYTYMMDKIDYGPLPYDFQNIANWPEHYANYSLMKKYGDCYCGGAGFAYLATAIGYKNVYAVSSGGHGWCMIGNAVYDPMWGWGTGRRFRYYGFTADELTGRDPNYFQNIVFKVRID